jgi:hypothetical protein
LPGLCRAQHRLEAVERDAAEILQDMRALSLHGVEEMLPGEAVVSARLNGFSGLSIFKIAARTEY